MIFEIVRRDDVVGRAAALLLAALAPLAFPCTLHAQPPEAGEEIRTLEMVARYPLPVEGEVPLDARWAGPDSIYVLYETTGVFEHELADGLPSRRQVMPDVETLQFLPKAPSFYNLGLSGEHVLVTSLGHQVAWRQRPTGNGGGFDVRTKALPGQFHDVDLDGERVLLLGFPTLDDNAKSPAALVWLGELSSDLDRWRAVYEDESLAGSQKGFLVRPAALGSVRFLGNGDFVVAPGFLPGVFYFSSTGKLKESWSPRQLSAASEEEDEEPVEVRTPEDFSAFLASTATIDEVLDLAGEPAVVVRDPRSTASTWSLVVLGDPIRRYSIPDDGFSGSSRLRGDVDDDGRIVLVGTSRGLVGDSRISSSAIMVLELPAP